MLATEIFITKITPFYIENNTSITYFHFLFDNIFKTSLLT